MRTDFDKTRSSVFTEELQSALTPGVNTELGNFRATIAAYWNGTIIPKDKPGKGGGGYGAGTAVLAKLVATIKAHAKAQGWK